MGTKNKNIFIKMSVQWNLVFVIMAAEVLFFFLLCLPLPIAWRHSILKFVSDKPSNHPVVRVCQFLFLFLAVLFIDSVQKLMKTMQKDEVLKTNPQFAASEHFYHKQLFLAQRN